VADGERRRRDLAAGVAVLPVWAFWLMNLVRLRSRTFRSVPCRRCQLPSVPRPIVGHASMAFIPVCIFCSFNLITVFGSTATDCSCDLEQPASLLSLDRAPLSFSSFRPAFPDPRSS